MEYDYISVFVSGHSLARTRQHMMPPLTGSCFFTIPDAYKTDYLDRERLLLHDSEDQQLKIEQSLYVRPEGRILIWSSDIQLNLLFNSEKLYMDVTFSSAPPYFNQV